MNRYAEELESIASIDALWPGIVDALRKQGINDVTYVSATGDPPANAVVHTTIPPLYDGINAGTEPFLLDSCDSYEIKRTGAEFLDDNPNLSDCARAFMHKARKHGFHSGFEIPTRLRCASRYGGFILSTGLPADEFMARMWPRAEELRLFCLLMHRKIEELDGTVNECDPDLIASCIGRGLGCLSPRELEVVTLLAKGMSRKEVAHVCGISANTVSDYAKSAYRKLGVHNRVQAAQLIFDASNASPDRKTG